MTGRLQGQVALVTGATRGIGAAVARLFAAEGAHVVLTGRTVGALEAQDDAIRAAGGTATLMPLDLLDPERIDMLGPSLYQRFGRLDILSSNAAIMGRVGPIGHLDAAETDRVFKLNLIANWRLIRTLDPLLRRAPRGRAVFATCAAGRVPTAYFSVYGATKAGLDTMVASWNAELRLTSLRAATVDPGPVGTALRRVAFPGEAPPDVPTPDAVAPLFLAAVLA